MKGVKSKAKKLEIDLTTDDTEENDSGYGCDRGDSPLTSSNPDTSGSGDGDDRDDSPIPEGQYEVEEILDYFRDKSGELYHVTWRGWTEEHNTWEPPSSLLNCQQALITFFKKRTTEIENFSKVNPDYVTTTENGTKRRRGSQRPPCLPPDPRPLQPRVKAFYEATRYPTSKEIKVLEALWKADYQKAIAAKSSKPPGRPAITARWHRLNLDRVLASAMTGQVMTSEAEVDLRKQLFLQERDELKVLATDELFEWEEELKEISEGKPKLSVENNVDWEGPPKEFTYINDYVPTGDIIIPNDPLLGCECSNCYTERTNCCPTQLHSSTFAYTAHKKVRVMAGTPIYECNSKCKCGPDCPNRVVQDGRVNISDLRLTIFRTANGRGWGVKTMKKIIKNTFVSLYLGEIITSDEAEKRGKEYDRNGCTYLFDLDINDGKEANLYTIDAAKFGNISHFINHSCDPNLAVYSVFVNCLDPNLPKLALFATRDIAKGEELSFDYEYQVNADPETDDEDDDRPKQPCYCGSSKCRKYFF